MDKIDLIKNLETLEIGLERFTVSHKLNSGSWAEAFNLARLYIRPALSNANIIHIGSTAIPNCIAKPILDIAIEYSVDSSFERERTGLVSLGFTSKGAYGIEGREFFTFYREDELFDYIHIHAFPKDHPHLLNHLTFKEALLHNSALVDQYNELKTDLVAQGISRKDYPDAKTDFVLSVLAQSNA
jgi:GrpB-like predicted nucleotidyltransferase (UPF0157 family)